MSKHPELGHWGEKIAEKYLVKKGYRVIDRNFHAREGEIDLVCQKNGIFIFIEVKTRNSKKFGYPEEAITDKKMGKIDLAAKKYLNIKNLSDRDYRMEFISISGDKDGKVIINHIQEA